MKDWHAFLIGGSILSLIDPWAAAPMFIAGIALIALTELV
jgi:hypothetical protein